MPKTNLAPFRQTIKATSSVVTAANTVISDQPTNAILGYTAGPEGGVLTRATAMPRGTVTANQLQMYRSLDAGVTKRLFRSAVMAAYTMNTTTAIPMTDMGVGEDKLQPNEQVWFAMGVALAAGVVFCCEGEDY